MEMKRLMHSEDGFSLTELLVVLALMGMLLTASYAGVTLSARAGEIQRRNDFIARNLVTPLQNMDVLLSQNLTLNATVDGYSFDCLVDQNNDNTRERHVFEATTDGRLVERVFLVSPTGAQTALRTTVWQRTEANPVRGNANRVRSRPLVTYYRIDSTTGARVIATPANATEAVLTLEIRYDGRNYSDTRRVLFRNR